MKRALKIVLISSLMVLLFTALAFADEPANMDDLEPGFYVDSKNGLPTTPLTIVPLDTDGEVVTLVQAKMDGEDDTVYNYYAEAVKLKVTCDSTSGKYYLVLLLNGEEAPNENNIIYIDQVTAEGGSTTFTAYPNLDKADGTVKVMVTSNDSENQGGTGVIYFNAGYMLGDVNGDKQVTAADGTCLLRHIGKIELITRSALLKAADTNKDGSVTASDGTKLLRAIGKIESL